MATDVAILFNSDGEFIGIIADEELNVIKIDYSYPVTMMPDGFKAKISRVPVTEDIKYTTNVFSIIEEEENELNNLEFLMNIEECELHNNEDWLEDKIIDAPKATTFCTSKQLTRNGLVGVYKRKDQ